jgi:hypothetical protein
VDKPRLDEGEAVEERQDLGAHAEAVAAGSDVASDDEEVGDEFVRTFVGQV